MTSGFVVCKCCRELIPVKKAIYTRDGFYHKECYEVTPKVEK